MSAALPDLYAARQDAPMASTFGHETFIPPYVRGLVEILMTRGHVVSVRRNRHGSNRYRIDGGRELQAVEMDRFYLRRYGP